MNTTYCLWKNQKMWNFGQRTCCDHGQDQAVKNLFEYDETVTYDPKTQYVGRIGRIEMKNPVVLETLP